MKINKLDWIKDWNHIENEIRILIHKYRKHDKDPNHPPSYQNLSIFPKWKKDFSLIYPDETLTNQLFENHLVIFFSITIAFNVYLKQNPTIQKTTMINKLIQGNYTFLFDKLQCPTYFRQILLNPTPISEAQRIAEQVQIEFLQDIDPFSHIHQSLLQTAIKQNKGEFYTQIPLAKMMISAGYNVADNVLDPSCGSGIFLRLIALHILNSELSTKAKNQAMKKLLGYDINPLSCMIARANILLILPPAMWKETTYNILQQDFLFPEPELDTPNTKEIDLIIGNPPWLVLNRIPSNLIKTQLKTIGNNYGILEGGKLATSTEITTIFIYHGLINHLKPGGKIFFVVPASLATGRQHQLFRQFTGMENVEFWHFDVDQYRIHNLCFSAIKSSAIKTKNENIEKNKENHISGIQKRSKVRWKSFEWINGQQTFKLIKDNYYIPAYIKISSSKPQKNSQSSKIIRKYSQYLPHSMIKVGKLIPMNTHAFSQQGPLFTYKKSEYHSEFRQGASLVPRNLLFVNIIKENSKQYQQIVEKKPAYGNKDLVLVKPASDIKPKMYSTWDFIAYSHKFIDKRYIFTIAKSTGLLPFSYQKKYYAFLPLEDSFDLNSKTNKFKVQAPSERTSLEHYNTLEQLYKTHQKRDAKITHLIDRLDYGHALSQPKQYQIPKVVYAGIGSIVKAAILRDPCIIDTSLYYFIPNSLEEAFFIVGYLNSGILTTQVKLVGSTGAKGSLRNIHKTPFQFSFPLYDPKQSLHLEISSHTREMEQYTLNFIQNQLDEEPNVIDHLKSLQNRIYKNKKYQQFRKKLDLLIMQLMT